MLIVFSGLPGVGKSTIADELGRQLRACVVSVDPIEDAILRSGIAASLETGAAAYQVGATIAEHQLRNGLDVIVDAANYLEVGRDVWRQVGIAAGSQLAVVEVMCSDVVAHRDRLRHRSRGLAAYPEPTWEEVERRVAETEPWGEPHLVVNAARPVDASVAAIVAYLTELRNPASSVG